MRNARSTSGRGKTLLAKFSETMGAFPGAEKAAETVDIIISYGKSEEAKMTWGAFYRAAPEEPGYSRP
jgi:hypothetical protein